MISSKDKIVVLKTSAALHKLGHMYKFNKPGVADGIYLVPSFSKLKKSFVLNKNTWHDVKHVNYLLYIPSISPETFDPYGTGEVLDAEYGIIRRGENDTKMSDGNLEAAINVFFGSDSNNTHVLVVDRGFGKVSDNFRKRYSGAKMYEVKLSPNFNTMERLK